MLIELIIHTFAQNKYHYRVSPLSNHIILDPSHDSVVSFHTAHHIMGCGSSAAAVHSEAPLAREPLRATQRQQQRRPVYTEVVQCSGCGVIARVAFGVAFCDQCTTKLDIAAKMQQANSELQVYYNKLYIILGG